MTDNKAAIEYGLLADVFKEVGAHFAELEGESSRAAAILAVAAMEDALDALLRSAFPNSTTDAKWKRIAGPGPTPFGNLKAKRDVAETFGFFGPKTNKTIEHIGIVRNKFAHRTTVREFDHPDILEWCGKLADNPVSAYSLVDNPKAADVRRNFIATVKELTDRLNEIQAYVPHVSKAVSFPRKTGPLSCYQ